nr:unnamed protein product [Haemonchus contortus]
METMPMPVTTPYSIPKLYDSGNHDFMSPIISQAQKSLPLLIKTVLSHTDAPPSSVDSNTSTTVDNENILAPVVEKAAFQLAKLLRVDQGAVSKKDPYPFTDFWQNTMQRIAVRY